MRAREGWERMREERRYREGGRESGKDKVRRIEREGV